MTRFLLLVAVGLTAALFVGVASSQAGVLMDINFDGSPYGADGSSVTSVADPFGSWSGSSWEIDTDNKRGGTASAMQTAAVFVDFSPNSTTKTDMVDSTLPLLVEWSMYRPETDDEIRLIVKGGTDSGASSDLWQMNLQADGDVFFERSGGSDEFNVTGNLTGWWDFQATLDMTGTAATKDITSVLFREPGAGGWTEVLPETRSFKNAGAFHNLMRWDGRGAAIGTAYDSIKISEIPEPSTLALLGVGGLGLVVLAFRRRRRK